MTYVSVPIERFGGLTLADPADVGLGSASDLLNVELDPNGAVKARGGWSVFNGTTGTNRYTLLNYYGGTLVALSSSALDVFSTSTGTRSSTTAITNPIDVVNYGTTSASYMYIARSSTAIQRWDGGSLTSPAGMPTAVSITVQTPDNRLVAAETVNNDQARVQFSNAGAPETWTANDYVMLQPGDGETIVAAVAWNNLVFVFKKSKFAVFYGNSTDSSGNPVFNYRMITGPCPLSKNAVAVARDGVYFINPAGVWRTTGGQPELVSGPVQALFRGALPPTFSTGVSLSQTSTAAAFTAGWQPDRLYFGIPLSNGATTATHTLVYDVRGGWWSIYDLAAGVLLGTPDTGAHPTQDHGLLFSYASGNKDIGKLDSTTTNNGSSLAAYWVSGNSDFGSPDYKSVRQIEVTGKASAGLTLAVGTDYGALGSTASLSPGSSVATVFDRRGWRGRQFRVKVAQASGTMEIERLVLRVRDRKSPGVSR